MKRLLYLLFSITALALVLTGAPFSTAFASSSACCVDTVGDVNLDGLVDMTDAMLLNGWLNCEDSNICMDAADWDGDGDVDWADMDALGMWADGGAGSPPGGCHSYSACNTVINSQPTDTIVTANYMPLSLTVDVTSNCEVYYRWYKNDTLIQYNCDYNELYLEVVSEFNGGVYYVEVLTVDDRVLTDSFTVTVIGATFDPPEMQLCHPDSRDVTVSIGVNPPGSVTVDVASTNPSVATFAGDQTGGTITTVGTGSASIEATYMGQPCGSMQVLAATISTDAGSPEYLCMNGGTQVINVTRDPSWAGYTISISDPGVVSAANNGSTINLTPVSPGTANIDLSVGGDTAACASFTVEIVELTETVDTVYVCLPSDDKIVPVSIGPPGLNWSITNTNSGVATATIVGETIVVSAVSAGFTTVDLHGGGAGSAIQCGSFVVEVTDVNGITTTAQHVSMCTSSAVDTVGVAISPGGTDWSIVISDSSVVSAVRIGDEVEITPLAPGYALVDLYAEGVPNFPCGDFTVSVFDISVSGPEPDSVCLDSIDYHTISILPAGDYDSVVVASSNPGVVTASLSSATTVEMLGVSEGTATIYLIYGGDTCGSYDVIVVDCVRCLDVGLLELCADVITSLGGDNYNLSGNVTIDSVLWFDADVQINTSTGALTGNGKIKIYDILMPVGPPAEFTLWNGPISATIVGDTLSDLLNPMVALTVGALGIEIDEIVLIPDGIHINGSIVLPSILGVDAEINSLELTTTEGVQIEGRIEYAGPLGMKGLQIKDIWFEFDSAEDTYAGGATMEIKQIVTIGGEIEIISGQVNAIGLTIEVSPGIAIDATGLSLVGGAGLIDHMADAEPILISVTVDITGGPSIAGVDLIKFDDVGVTVQPPRYFGVAGSFLVFDIPVAQAEASYQPPKFSLAFTVNFLDVLKGGFSASLTGTQFAGHARVTVGTPCDLPAWLAFLRCKKFGGAEIDVNNSRLRGRVWIRIRIKIWPFPAFHINLEGAFKLEYSSNGVHFYIGTNYNSLAKIFKNTNKAGLYQEGFAIPEHSETALFMVKGENGVVPAFRLIRPDLSVADSTQVGLVRMEEDSVAFYVVQNPEAGLWVVEIPDDGGQPVEIYVLSENTRPAIAFVDPAANETDGHIQWHDHDPDDDAKINLFFDDDNRDFDGVLINPTPISENSEIDQYTWDMANVDPGDYYIYGVIEDTNNAPYRVYAPGKITIPNTLGPGAPSALTPTYTDTSVWLSWTPSPDLVLGYEVRYTDDTTSATYNNHWTVGDTNNIEITDLVTGRPYKMAIRCFDSLNNISDMSASIYVMINNSLANDPPMITKTGIPEFAQVGQLYSFNLISSDVDGPGTLIILDSVPSGYSIPVPGDNEINWTPDSTQVGVYWIQIRVDDQAGGEDTLGYLLHVVEADRSYGGVQWGAPIYGGTYDPAIITLQDFDLDLSEYAIDSTAVLVTSDSDPAGVTVWLKQIHPTSVDFIGTVGFSLAGSGPGVIHVSDSDLVTVTYADDAPDPQDVVDVAKWVLSLGCCRVITGNVDDDPDDQIDISDLVYLVDYMFNGGPQPVCVDEANIDGNGSGLTGIDISDLVYLVDYMFVGGPLPPNCP